MRTLLSWVSVATLSLIAQLITFIFSGIGLGYGLGALQMYKLNRFEAARDIVGSEAMGGSQAQNIVTGLHDKDWVDLRQAVTAYDLEAAVSAMPVLGWYFLAGFIIGGTLSIVVINIATIHHLRRLAQGGRCMAEKLGALPLDANDAAGSLSDLHKIVHQLSKRFELTPPAVFLLDEEGMNAFVVGRKRNESVLVVSNGLRHMSRKELSGVVAHELAHVRNGDMVHNMRLLAVELGIHSVRHTAEWMLRRGTTLMFGSSSNYRFAMTALQWGFLLCVLGLTLWPMGLISSIIGTAIMAMTNRRREMRADRLAARVLGTWEPIGDALKRILGHDVRGRIMGHDGRKLGHLMFAQANGSSGGLLDTHPKLQRRIKKADRHWDGVPLFESETETKPVESPTNDTAMMKSLSNLPVPTMELFLDSKASVLTVPALLLFQKSNQPLAAQLQNGKLVGPIESLWSLIADVTDEEWFALLELALRNTRESQDPAVLATLKQIHAIAPSNHWELQCWLALFIDAFTKKPKTFKVKHKNFRSLFAPTLEVVSIGVSIGKAGLGELRFQRMWGLTGLGPVGLMDIEPFEMDDLEKAVMAITEVPLKLRASLVDGFAEGLLSQNSLGTQEAVFLKYLCHRWGVASRMSIAPGSRLPC